ncbi:MAG: sigma-54-dependent Fis family transcriptional regulator, partial [Bdellovibrionales bacterium]|nr:sigma-54-dependent Fis family transcriptional regulator [Bdellovibrionales bacterium]
KYDWPGNIRELENVIEHAFILEETNLIGINALPEAFLRAVGINITGQYCSLNKSSESSGSSSKDEDKEATILGAFEGKENELVSISGEALDFNLHKEAFEKEFIVKALRTFKGRINQTALHANIPKKTLLRKIEKYGIVARDYVE